MRLLRRPALSSKADAYLDKKQREVDAGKDVSLTWEGARKTRTMQGIADTLSKMNGPRQRCMLCSDSLGVDMDHFWPKVRYPRRAFRWLNFLASCTPCNRDKGDDLLLDAQGQPLLIDPTVDDPWQFLFFEPLTGLVTARVRADTGAEDERGSHTVDLLKKLSHEAVVAGRGIARRHLVRAVQRFLESAAQGLPGAQNELLEAIADGDAYGLADWYFLYDGVADEPFRSLQRDHASTWNRVVAVLRARLTQ